MVVCFIFVIIGLSLVSMCINVIQSAIEDLYKRLLMKILMDYQAKLAQDGDQKGASVGMMRMWGKSKTAKYLMPMLRNQDPDRQSAIIEELVRHSDQIAHQSPPIELSIQTVDCSIQTDEPVIKPQMQETDRAESPIELELEEFGIQTDFLSSQIDKADQTSLIGILEEYGTQTEIEEKPLLTAQTDQQVQTDIRNLYEEKSNQTENVAMLNQCEQTSFLLDEVVSESTTTQLDEVGIQTEKNLEIQTELLETCDRRSQTNEIELIEKHIQTSPPTPPPVYKDQTEQTQSPEQQNIRVQTDSTKPDTRHHVMQTDPVEMAEVEISKIGRKIRKAFQKSASGSGDNSKRRVSHGDRVTLGDWPEELPEEAEVESGSSYESLNWDPIDGLHAEKQRPVKDLKKMFDRAKNTSVGPSSSFRSRQPPQSPTSGRTISRSARSSLTGPHKDTDAGSAAGGGGSHKTSLRKPHS